VAGRRLRRPRTPSPREEDAEGFWGRGARDRSGCIEPALAVVTGVVYKYNKVIDKVYTRARPKCFRCYEVFHM
jgi:hypothetical protein